MSARKVKSRRLVNTVHSELIDHTSIGRWRRQLFVVSTFVVLAHGEETVDIIIQVSQMHIIVASMGALCTLYIYIYIHIWTMGRHCVKYCNICSMSLYSFIIGKLLTFRCFSAVSSYCAEWSHLSFTLSCASEWFGFWYIWTADETHGPVNRWPVWSWQSS